ncbi:MAG: hypothetical protein ABSB94_08615 [Syntrophorhabdales bacterium]|jgi:hypothetical protein
MPAKQSGCDAVLAGRFGNGQHNLALHLRLFDKFMGTPGLRQGHTRRNDELDLVLGQQIAQLDHVF